MILGDFPQTVELSQGYFEQRHINLDCRGTLKISAESNWGFFVTVITESHDIDTGVNIGLAGNRVIDRPVVVGKLAWIGSRALLYNCIIGEGAVVALGTVVRSCEVMPYTMVVGNPAQVLARFNGAEWIYAKAKWGILA